MAAFVTALGSAACDGFISGPGLTDNPNAAIDATPEQLFIGVQAQQFVRQQGQLARQTAIYTQQIAGIFNQQLEFASEYRVTGQDIEVQWDGFYIGGGLVDMRKIREAARESGAARLEAMTMVWEALAMGTATSLWGDIPYREAANPEIASPKLDPQEQVYADLQELLSEAISILEGLDSSPMPLDLVYEGDVDRWIAAAHTLKARYYLHVAPRHGQAAYQAARDAALKGIMEAPGSLEEAMHGQAPGDFRAWHGSTVDDANIWAQFYEARADLAANERMIKVLVARGDPRLEAYFQPATDGEWRGANQFGRGPTPYSSLNREYRMSRTFRQPFITWMENQLILAEAEFQLGNGDAALGYVNDVRASLDMDPLPGPITLEQIMVEKWIAQYQNIDVYSDYRRTCYPRLVPGGPNAPVPAAEVPGRLPYGLGEEQQNPNVPSPSEQPAKNWNFADITCPTDGGTL